MVKFHLRRLGNHSLIYGLGGIFNRYLSYLLLPVFTLYLTPADYGIVSMLGLITFIATPIFSLGFTAAIAPPYFEGNNQRQKEATIWTALTVLLASVSAWTVVGTIFAPQISWITFQTSKYDDLVTITLFSIGISILYTPFRLYLQFEERAKLFIAITAVSSLAILGLDVIMVVILEKGIKGLITGQLIGQIITLALFALVSIHRLKFRLSQHVGKDLLRLGLPLMPSFAFLFLLLEGNKYVVQWLQGLEPLGIYTVGFNLGSAIKLVTSGIQRAWLPFFMSFIDKKEEAGVLFGRVFTYYVLGIGTLNVVFYIFARPVVMMLTQSTFHSAYQIVGLSASAFFLSGVYVILLPGMYFAKEPQVQTAIQAVAALLALGLNFWLVPLFGLLGAGLALALGMFALTLLTFAWNFLRRQKYLTVQYEWQRIFRFSLIYIFFVIVTLWERTLPLLDEILFSGGMLILLLSLSYFLLNDNEKKFIGLNAKRLFHRVSLRTPLKVKG